MRVVVRTEAAWRKLVLPYGRVCCCRLCAAKLNKENGWDIKIHIDGASGGFVVPFLYPDLRWDFRLKNVVSINASGHKCCPPFSPLALRMQHPDGGAWPLALFWDIIRPCMHGRPASTPAAQASTKGCRAGLAQYAGQQRLTSM